MELSQILILLVVVWTTGKIFRRFDLPVIFGELLAGLIVGPSILGLVHPNETILLLSELGVFFLMLHSGLETDPEELYKSSWRSLIVAIGGIVPPFLLGYIFSIYLGLSIYQSLFIGVALSTTAIAITSRILKSNNLNKCRIGHITMGAAMISDILSLILFSIIIELIRYNSISITTILILILKIILFFGVVIFVGTNLFHFLKQIIYKGNKGFTFTLIIALSFGLLAEYIGLHIIVGAYLAGLFIKEEIIDQNVFEKIEDRIYGISYSFLGPIFFASLAFHINFNSVFNDIYFLIIIILIAGFGKIFGSSIAAKLTKENNKDSILIGFAMNGRGAVELIIASLGLNLGLIDDKIFSALIVMSLIMTLIASGGVKYIKKIYK